MVEIFLIIDDVIMIMKCDRIVDSTSSSRSDVGKIQEKSMEDVRESISKIRELLKESGVEEHLITQVSVKILKDMRTILNDNSRKIMNLTAEMVISTLHGEATGKKFTEDSKKLAEKIGRMKDGLLEDIDKIF